ncbi:MAG: PadR family transcriptional regulator [Vicinamibacterales bacterium]|jgi:PadR family transcriptional regulator PadR
MGGNDKFTSIRKGLLEFLILKIISADKVYVADMLDRLSKTEFATQEGTLYPLLSKLRRDGLVDYEWQESEAGPPRKYYELTAKGKSQLAELNDYWKSINATVNQLGR